MASRCPKAELRTKLGRACAELEARLRAGEPARAEDYFAADPALAGDADAAIELIYAEFVTRGEFGPIPACDDWCARFPRWAKDLRDLFQIHELVEAGLDEALSEANGVAGPAAELGFAGAYPFRLGHFEMLEETGRGATGMAFKARDLNLGRLVALKMIRPEAQTDGDLSRIRVEAEAVARLQHPNIVQIYEISEVAGRPFISLEFVDGGSLKQAMAGAPQAPRAAAALLEVVARAIAYAHRRGVVHRDLKPANVLLTTDGVPKVADFSLAKLVNREWPSPEAGEPGRRAAILGTIGYMAPEQFGSESGQDGLAADIYSLGAMLYEFLTGRTPCGVDSYLENLVRGTALDPPPPSQLRAGIPGDLDAIAMKCLRTDPALRYPDAGALADDLRRFLAGEPVEARPFSLGRWGWQWAKRRPTAAALATVSALAAVSLLVGSVWYNAQLSALAMHTERLRGKAEQQAVMLHDQLEFSRRSLYALQLTHVQGAIRSNPGLCVLLLNDARYCPPDLRDFTWSYYFRLSRRKRRDIRYPLFGPVNAVAFAPDGKTLAVAGAPAVPSDPPGQIKLYTPTADGPYDPVAHGRALGTLRDAEGTVLAIAYSPDGRTLASGGGRIGDPGAGAGIARLWDTATGKERSRLEGHTEPVLAVAFSPDGRVLATSGGDSTVRLWESDTGALKAVLRGHNGAVRAVAFAPDGRTLATGDDRAIRLWDVRSGEERHTLNGHQARVNSLAFSPNGALLVSAGADKVAVLWELAEGRPRAMLRGHLAAALTAAFSADGSTVITGGEEGIVRLWRAEDGLELSALNFHYGPVTSIAFDRAGGLFASGSLDRSAKVWDLVPGRQRPPLRGHDAKVTAALFCQDDATLITAGGDRAIRLWDVAEGRVRATLRNASGTIHCLALNRNQSLLATGDDAGMVKLWDPSGGRRPLALRGHTGPVTALAFAPDGLALASASLDATVRLWDPARAYCRSILRAHPGGIQGVAFSIDGALVATAGEDWDVKLWRVADGRELATLKGHHLGVVSLAFHPDGRTLATGSKDRTIKLWDLASRKEKVTLWGHNHWVCQIAFSPDAKTMASSTGDPGPNAVGEVKLWDAVTGHVRATFEGQTEPLAFSANGNTLLTGNHDETLNLLEVEEPPTP